MKQALLHRGGKQGRLRSRRHQSALRHGASTVNGHLVSAPVGKAHGIEVADLDALFN
jgi:hypothetical protein